MRNTEQTMDLANTCFETYLNLLVRTRAVSSCFDYLRKNSSVSVDPFLEIKKTKTKNNKNRLFSTLTFPSHLGYS